MTYVAGIRIAAFGLLSLGITACHDAGSTGASVPSTAEQACLRDVTQTTNNPDVQIMSSIPSDAGIEAIVGVGEPRAPWRCIGYADGSTEGIESLVDEGLL